MCPDLKLCECGCGEPAPLASRNHSPRGWKRGVHGHNGRVLRHPIEWFYRVEDMGYATPCWVWIRSRHHISGYGQYKPVGRGSIVAHRYMYELNVGPIPGGLTLDHLCRVRPCVNPDHMDPVTIQENIRRGHSASTLAHLAGTCTRGHPASESYIRKHGPRAGYAVYCRTCRREDRRAA